MKKVDWKRYYPLLQPNEFVCKCGCGLLNMHPEHMERLFLARKIAGVAFVIRSGSRCPAHNASEGGTDTSDHIFGHGTDVEALISRHRYLILDALLKAGFNRIGIGRSFLHAGDYPDNPPEVAWLY